MSRGVRRPRLVVPRARRRQRAHRALVGRARDRGEHPADPRDRAGRAADAAGVRLRACTTTSSRRRMPRRPAPSATPCASRCAFWEPRIDVDRRHRSRSTTPTRACSADRHRLRDPRHERPAQPRLPVLRHPATDLGATAMTCHAPTSTTAASRTSSTTPSASSPLRCPEWTDHNVSDPGVTLIETFAFMTDELLYRLNRVPDRLYLAFLDLHRRRRCSRRRRRRADVVLLARRAARPTPVVVPARTEVGTPRTETAESIVFATTDDLRDPAALAHATSATGRAGRAMVRDAHLGRDTFDAFADPAEGRRRAPPRPRRPRRGPRDHASHLDCAVRGVGVDPLDPPIVWEAWNGSGWTPCDVVVGRHRRAQPPGDVVLIVPRDHVVIRHRRTSARAGCTADRASARRRCRRTRRRRSSAPRPPRPSAGWSHAMHAHSVDDEILGLSRGRARPVVPARASVRWSTTARRSSSRCGAGGGWDEWTEVDSFAGSADGDRHVIGGPHSRHRAVPARGARGRRGDSAPTGRCRRRAHRCGCRATASAADVAGNVGARALSVLRSTVPFVSERGKPRGRARRHRRRDRRGGEGARSARAAHARPRGDRCRTTSSSPSAPPPASPARTRSPRPRRVGVRLLVVPTAVGRRRRPHRVRGPRAERRTAGTRSASDLEPRRTVGARLVIERPRLPGRHGRREARRASAGRRRAAAQGRARGALPVLRPDPRRCRRAPDGRSDGPCSPARCTRCCRRCPGRSSWTRCCSSARTRSTGKRGEPRAAHRPRARTPSCSASRTACA